MKHGQISCSGLAIGFSIRCSIVVSMSACHAEDPGFAGEFIRVLSTASIIPQREHTLTHSRDHVLAIQDGGPKIGVASLRGLAQGHPCARAPHDGELVGGWRCRSGPRDVVTRGNR